VFTGTIAENVHLHQPEVSMTAARNALDAVGLLDDVLRLPKGLDTEIDAAGGPLVPTQLSLLMIARAIAARPRLLLIDGLLDALGDRHLLQVADFLLADVNEWTLLVATNRREVAGLFSRVLPLAGPPTAPASSGVPAHIGESLS
jgi:putative ABC transport system ATP-binding protein